MVLIEFYLQNLVLDLFFYNLLFLILSLVLGLILLSLSQITFFQKLLLNSNLVFFYKASLFLSLLASFLIIIYMFQSYHFYFSEQLNFYLFFKKNDILTFKLQNFLDNSLSLQSSYSIFGFFTVSFDYFGVIFLFLAYVVAFLSFLALDTRFFFKNWYYFVVCNALILVINLFTVSNDIVIFFLLYEGLLFPSFVFVYRVSQSQRGVQASLYFVIWTQVGSFMVLFSVLYIVYVSGYTNYNSIYFYVFSQTEIFILYFFIFLGFGIKIPIYPFHYWLTKTHVEAPTGFSIFLSGFLVKSALFGFYKFNSLLGFQLNSYLALLVCLVGSVDASLKMWHQVDLKKLVAYGTIQEMNLIFIPFCFGDSFFLIGGILFCITHGFLSAYFFYLVDCIQRRCNTRSVNEVYGLFYLTPSLGLVIFIGLLLYSGLPGTLKFISEVYIFVGLLNTTPLVLVFLIFGVNFLGIIGFAKIWFNVIFGFSPKLQKKNLIDLTLKEFFFFFICVSFLFFFQISINF